VLPLSSRLTRSRDFAAITRRGRRAGSPTVVVHALATSGEPRLGFVVSRSVGVAVVRNRVTRRLRHACRDRLVLLGSDVVVRALPRAARTEHSELLRDLDSCLRRAGALRIGAAGPVNPGEAE
jgi:ribonuclease P protein component